MSASVSYGDSAHVWRANARPDSARAFQRARRHSRFVRVARVALPSGVLLAGAIYFITPWLNPFSGLAAMPTLSKLTVSGSRITMDLPRLAGYTRDGRAYELTAAAAAQDLKRPQLIELQEIRAKVELVDGNVVNVTAGSGNYDTKSEAMSLRQNVLVATSDGTEIRLSEAHMDVRKGHVVSNQPVQVLLQLGRIDAQQLEVVDSGAVIHFRGGVQMNLQPEIANKRAERAEQPR